MADEEKEEGAEGKKKGPPKLIIFLAGGMVVLAVVAFVLVKFVFAPKAETEMAEESEEVIKDPKEFGHLFSFDQAIVVNLAETNGQRYLKVNLQLEMNKPELEEELLARAAQMMDLIITVLSSKTIEEASTTIGRNRLKREIVDRINAEIVTGKIVNIFFTEFVIQ